MTRAIVTVGISETRLFAPYLERWHRTFSQHGGADYLKAWRHEWPPNSPTHRECHYGFKVHAVYEAWKRGHTSILWFDASAYAVRDLAPLWERLERDGHVLLDDANRLGQWSSDHALAHFGVSRDEAMQIPLMVGTCFGLDFRLDRSREFLRRLMAVATPEHFNGTHVSRLPGLPTPATEGEAMSTDPRVSGHRSDEVHMALIARELGMKTHTGVEFSGGDPGTERTCVRSGYDLPRPDGGAEVRAEDSAPRLAQRLEDVHGHTIDMALLRSDGVVLDAGCRDFLFARAMAERGCRVIALDPDPTIEDPCIPGVVFFHLALAAEAGERQLLMAENPEARRLLPADTYYQAPQVRVQTTTIARLLETLGVDRFDAVKLDIEGAESEVLAALPGAVAKQVSVEFHGEPAHGRIGEWYDVVQHERTERHGIVGYWDSLFVER